MAAAFDQLAAARPDAVDLRRHWRRSRRRGWRRRSLPASVGWPASSETRSAALPAAMPAGPAPSAAAPPAECFVEQPAAGRAVGAGRARCARGCARRCEYSSWRNSSATPISTLESEPMPKRPPASRKRLAGERAVAEIGFGDGAKPGDCAASRPMLSVSASVMCVAWIRHQRRSTSALASSHSTGRAPDQATQSSTSFICSATWMWIGPPRPARRPRAVLPASRRAGCAARRRPPRRRAAPPRAGFPRAGGRSASGSLMKRRWPSFGAAPPKPECA